MNQNWFSSHTLKSLSFTFAVQPPALLARLCKDVAQPLLNRLKGLFNTSEAKTFHKLERDSMQTGFERAFEKSIEDQTQTKGVDVESKTCGCERSRTYTKQRQNLFP